MKRPLRIRQLEALMAVSKNGSITAAAAELEISQPAVSRLLSDLEKEFGFNLFDKHKRELTPSQEVRLLQPDILRVLELIRQISEDSQEVTKRKAGHIRVACLPGFATSHLPDVVASFLKDRPGASMTIEPDRPERILEWMIGEQYHFGITDGFLGHHAIESEDIDIRCVCIFPSGHDFERLAKISPKDLADYPLIHTRKDSAFYSKLAIAFQEFNVIIQSYIEVRQFTSACELVCRGAGLAVVSELDATKYVGHGLSYRPFVPNLSHSLSLVRPIFRKPALITLEFMEFFRESLKPYTR